MQRSIRHSAGIAALTLLSLAGPCALAAHAQAWAKANLDKSPRHGEYVTIHEAATGRNLQAWVVYPEVKGKAPVLVMIHEIFGLSDWAREMADEVAAQGFIVVEPDLLSGYGPASASTTAPCDTANCSPGKSNVPQVQPGSQAGSGQAFLPATPGGTAAFPDQSAVIKAVSSLPDGGVLADLDAASDYGEHLPSASGKLFVSGFCWGGGKTFLFATHRKDVSGSFVFYGPPPPAEAMSRITAPVYGFYAGKDARITATVDSTKTAMKAAGKVYEPVVYDGAGHGFMRLGEAPNATPEDAAARQAGFQRLIELLRGTH